MGKDVRIGVIIVAYNAVSTLAAVLDRIPQDFRSRITKVFVGDDASSDSTHLVAVGYQQTNDDLEIDVVHHPVNLGYGGNQKAGYRWAIDNDLDVVVLLHGDGQYAPEIIEDLVAPIAEGRADAVLGSRMLDRGAARRGGMPRYKYVGNRILTTFENAVVGVDLSEWHTGYRAYSVAALADIPFDRNADGFNFDTQIIVQLVEAGKRLAEVPIPTYYGDEICHVNGIAYARDVAKDVVRYRAHKMGFGTGDLAFNSSAYEAKGSADSSHGRLLQMASSSRPGRVLDLGCSDGWLAEQLRRAGHRVVGVDIAAEAGVKERVDEFIQADLDAGVPPEVEGSFDLVILADVLEHVRHPEKVLHQLRPMVARGGRVLVSVPNFAHWYPRARVAIGRFDYDRRGILDRDHVRMFTRRSIERLVREEGFVIAARDATGLPLDVADRDGSTSAEGAVPRDDAPAGTDDAAPSRLRRIVAKADRAAVVARPQLFGYQFLYDLRPAPVGA